MTEKIKIVLIVSISAITIAGLCLYYSPYQQCVRGSMETGVGESYAKMNCVMGVNEISN
jgi:hypothetical protein